MAVPPVRLQPPTAEPAAAAATAGAAGAEETGRGNAWAEPEIDPVLTGSTFGALPGWGSSRRMTPEL